MSFHRTVIISCAGAGSRLGLGTTKALLEIEGKSLIARHLEMLEQEDDIRIVVGYQAQEVIHLALQYRRDITFVFNHDYKTTSTGASVALASRHANEYILSLDGDLLIHPDDMKKILQCTQEFVGGGVPETDDPWMLQTFQEQGREYVSLFSKNDGIWEWNGVTQMKSAKMQNGTGHVFQLLQPYLPLPFMKLRTKEVDTINDYERAVMWVKNGFQ